MTPAFGNQFRSLRQFRPARANKNRQGNPISPGNGVIRPNHHLRGSVVPSSSQMLTPDESTNQFVTAGAPLHPRTPPGVRFFPSRLGADGHWGGAGGGHGLLQRHAKLCASDPHGRLQLDAGLRVCPAPGLFFRGPCFATGNLSKTTTPLTWALISNSGDLVTKSQGWWVICCILC